MSESPRHARPREAQQQGFQMSGRRAVTEIALIVGVVGVLLAGVLWLTRWGAERLATAVPVAFDRSVGEQSARLVAASSHPCTNPAAQRYVETVAAPLIAALADRRFDFHFVVVDDAEVNAFALPGGFVTVDSGLLSSAESGDEVAAVLAHELQHVVLRHGTRRVLRELGTAALLGALFGGSDIAVPASVTRDFASKAYGRDEESEADERGLELMVRAGLDPRGMATFFERLAKTSEAPPTILSTHPDPGDRAEKAKRVAAGTKATKTLPSPKGIACR
jgi:predicted Zn-dependent protease